MTRRELLITVVICALLTAGRLSWGDWVVLAYFFLIGVGGLLLLARYERHRARAVRNFAALDSDERDLGLVLIENNPVRADIVADLGLAAPRVPLRGAREEFRYPPDTSRTARWTRNAWTFLGGLVALGSLTDVVRGTNVFNVPDAAWWDAPALAAMFAAGILGLWWIEREYQGVLVVTDEALAWEVPGRAPKRIRWEEVTRVRRGATSQSLVVRSATTRIALAYQLVGYGRAVNLVTTRVPPATQGA